MIKIKILFVFTLLITISLIEAVPNQLVKRTTKFGQCDGSMKPLNVTSYPPDLVPNSEVALYIKGDFGTELTEKAKLFVTVSYSDWKYDYRFSGNICSIMKCPLPANFEIQTAVLLKDLPSGYLFSVTIFTDYDKSHDLPQACAVAKEK
ncbi:unnamed protein product [Rhizophagus irregularis]|uniref:MD-2-related lipid-recognition domain-containing protein n=1 Tax=Rhizophagus irregularis TaxID=588596 RepID=A0A2I1HI21_9GLOM|nr:hypothetical protein RhiirA4_480494 [Rhizophagus irregularis]CAB4437439.1 unnamed protein product [Rhizophagus irregularis]CAB4437532.1 unnamed protein product [Rhizophagus irregularis]